jgi:sigma-B regulation protein RsbU (phosphoserine phosphatase)
MFNPPLKNSNFEPISAWEKIIRMGELSPAHTSINLIHQDIIATAEEIFSGRAFLWLNKDIFKAPHLGLSNRFTFENPVECTPLMHSSITKQRMISKVEKADEFSKRYSLTAPIYFNQNLCGELTVERLDHKFTPSDRKLFTGLIMQTSITLAATRQRIIDLWSIELLELVRNVSQHIIDIFNIDELSKRVTQLICDKFHYYYVAVFTAELDKQILQFRYSAGTDLIEGKPGNLPNFLASGIRFGEGIIGQVALSGCEILENNVAVSQHYRYIDGLPETRSEFALPLLINNQIVGVLDVQSDKVSAFSDIDSLVLRALADHIAIAISNAQLYSDVNQRANHLSIVADISRAISSILDFDHLLNNIVSLIHIRFSIHRVNLFTVHTGRRKIFFRACAGQSFTAEELIPGVFSYDLDTSQGLVPWAVQNQQSITINDVSRDSRFSVSPASPDSISSQMVIPLVFGDQILGVIDLQSPLINAFTPDEVYILEALADYLSVALRNANLYSSEQWRRQVSESIREVAGLLSANIDFNHILVRILQELHKSLPCEASAIWLVESSEDESAREESSSPLRLAAIFPDNETLQELLLTDNTPGAQSPWMLEAINSPTPLIRLPKSPYEPLGAFLNFPPEYSAIAAPLRANNLTLGLLVLIHSNQGRYGSESQAMTATFASYSAVAINNTRLYEAAHDQAWVATVLLQVAEATQSITSMAELLETVVRIIPRLIGLKSCVLFTWDEVTETFLPASEYGLNTNQLDEYHTWHIAPGEVTAFDHILDDKYPVIIDRSIIPQETTVIKFNSLDIENELWGLFPMVAQNTVRGAIMINFTSPEGYFPNSQELFEEKFVIIQGIANQTAVALENIMLLQSQEEEAYTSVALLQVAQAIVSINNLDEIIGTIVRITPILVGVKRCVVYLYDADNQEFRRSQSYGISKQELIELPSKYGFNESAFLHSIQSTGNPIYRFLSKGDEAPTKWDKYSPLDYEIAPVHSEIGNIETSTLDFEYLKYKGRLLLGFPLTYKGNVLGIMIIEEADNPKGAPSYHIRLRRLEIITGITQQAALAIHNDLLQREVVLRERLEREMQLAREIQTTFLPEDIPPIPGWDLDIRWRPARQVGGDFYDLIHFDDGRIGLIMADVADKGMPAALFMILVRTLIRSAAKDKQSPAEILMQVNDLLVPDSKHGMFVTVLIVVFSPKDGTITFANAGHNPPIVHRTNNALQEMLPTGMALGILENITIGEQSITITPGEKIIIYTDGVTEAFSAEDEMFGVERLRTTILAGNDQSASALLDTIELALGRFLGAAPQSDDLTLAALIRK